MNLKCNAWFSNAVLGFQLISLDEDDDDEEEEDEETDPELAKFSSSGELLVFL